MKSSQGFERHVLYALCPKSHTFDLHNLYEQVGRFYLPSSGSPHPCPTLPEPEQVENSSKSDFTLSRGVCLQCWILFRPGEEPGEEPGEAFLWCKKGLEALKGEEVPSLVWPGDDSPIPGTGGDDLR